MSTCKPIIALDFNLESEANYLIERLYEFNPIWKIGLELFTSVGMKFIDKLVDKNQKVFLDLKLHDIPNTVSKTVKVCAMRKVSYLTIHLSSGREAFRQSNLILKENDSDLKILGVGVLSSFSDTLWRELGKAYGSSDFSVVDSAIRFSRLGKEFNVGGLVCASHELPIIRKEQPDQFLVVPGIKFDDEKDKRDQARTISAFNAKKLGANCIVVGRTITRSKDPVLAMKKIMKELE